MANNSYIKFTSILFVIYIASLLFCGAFFYNRIKVLDKAFDSVTHSVRIKQKLRQVEAEISSCESAQRGFLLTGDSVFLEHFHVATRQSRQAADTISLLTAGNSEQAAHAAELQELVNVRINLLKRTMETEGFRDADVAIKRIYLLNGKKIMDSLLGLNDKMLTAENELLEERKKYRDEARELTPKYVLGILMFSVLVVSICYYALLKFHRKNMSY
ncbi:MAG TPA: CHASE3 domain-containing protein [Flavipsychrobacter sp.]